MKINGETLKTMEDYVMVKFENKEETIEQMNEIAEMLGVLDECDTSGTEPLIHLQSTDNIFREDEVNQTVSRDEVLSNAKETFDGYFVVPQTVEQKFEKLLTQEGK